PRDAPISVSPRWRPLAVPAAVAPAVASGTLQGERSAQATLAAWQRYRHACELRLRLDPPAPGPVCNRSFDMYVCWGDAPPNSTATVPCPWYLPWHHRVQGGVVARRCGPDGQWVTDGTGRPWRDHSQCEDLEQEQPLQDVPCCVTTCRAVSPRAVPFYVTPLYTVPCHVTPCRAIW
ncbi:glucagon receptor-like, partial [Oxyura jamaicensis]|uniref:glucagon receptor-like n=1 Tax=Oxyura jamaicensis TaxID=8884 RepID=UPI0015A6BBE4